MRIYGVVTMTLLSGAVAMAQPPEGGPPGGPGGERRGPPSPEQFVERAMSFDADGDGKLDRNELMKFSQEMAARRMRGGPGGPDGPRGGGPRRGPPPDGDGERPERPRRPE
jgi:hypothetical protein